MNFDWTTFVLEAVNFLILVWLLKRFLYRPVLDVIARRQAAVARTLAEAEAARSEALRLRAEYESRKSDWERERAGLRQALEDELETLRGRRLEQLAGELETERRRADAARQREREIERRELETRALQQADAFAASLLERFAGSELDSRIVELLFADLERLPAGRRAALGVALAGGATVRSARPLAAEAQARLEQGLTALANRPAALRYEIEPGLISGLRLQAGAWELAADLEGELRAFAEFGAHE